MALVITDENGRLASREDRKQFEAWLAERLREEDCERAAAARKKNGAWRNFWTTFGGDLLFAACGIGVLTILFVIYEALETAGWIRL